MVYEKIKDSKQLRLKGIKIEAIIEKKGDCQSVTFTDTEGNSVVCQNGQYSNMNVFVVAPPDKVKRFRVTATVADVPIVKDFEGEYEAKNKVADLSRVAEDAKFELVEVDDIPF
jgi:hypothetical protein